MMWASWGDVIRFGSYVSKFPMDVLLPFSFPLSDEKIVRNEKEGIKIVMSKDRLSNSFETEPIDSVIQSNSSTFLPISTSFLLLVSKRVSCM